MGHLWSPFRVGKKMQCLSMLIHPGAVVGARGGGGPGRYPIIQTGSSVFLFPPDPGVLGFYSPQLPF